MQYYYSQLFILFLCMMIIINDGTNGLKIRLPSLRITSTFSKTGESIKKKVPMNNNRIDHPAKKIPLKVPDIGKKDDF
ncbi:unnamed protein product [Rotaria sordida]|uniref:Uncharacterized protein n=1 Tax=Rotaria sordida TaxID=392033 RepID=A0A818YQ93_9BILA|nr:unnamed protein product [Rotaria sordida]CAF1237880.1 unnamed protein product [Rotaria sordida]CAF1253077.1 unnamed protein product [Rotaria sordida]CAF1414615.1 unnamed protein product [Rotaria sordida]CAF3757502.1 unnamed protein product [Rotaria sordida]